jgi:ABC-type multidrug transport system permease subunit
MVRENNVELPVLVANNVIVITYITTFVMSAIFRTTAALTQTASQAMTGAGILVLALVIYTGFVIRIPQMHPWFSWIRW